MFSSTIIGIKLPTTALHHKHSGELVVGMLLMQVFGYLCVAISLSINSGDHAASNFLVSLISSRC